MACLAAAIALLLPRPAPAQTNGYVPLFQYAIFYNSLLEFVWAPPLTVNGPVRVNGDIYWGSSASLTLNDTVVCSGAILETNWDGFTTNEFTGTITCKGVPPTITNAPFASLSFGVSNSPSILHGMIEIPPPGEDPNSPMGQLRYYNKAQVVILVSNSTVSALVQNPSSSTLLTNLVVSYKPTSLAPTNFAAITSNLPFLSLTNYFMDQRESKVVKVSQIDIGTLNRWLLSSFVTNYFPVGGASYPNTFYIADERTDAGTTNGTEMIAVRLTNGISLPTNGGTGFTLATANPVYVWGNYNTPNSANLASTNVAGTMPASLVADALTILSANWQDRYSSNALNSRPPANSATIDAALLAGIVYSIPPASPVPPSQSSGGVVNLPRLLEIWGSASLWLNTSLVNLFPSTVATNQYEFPGIYYDAPTREFSFNPNYETASGLPPGTPLICTLIPAATLGPISLVASNQFGFSVAGVPGLSYAVQASTDLLNWVPLCTNTSPFVFSDTNASLMPQRFYRSVYLP